MRLKSAVVCMSSSACAELFTGQTEMPFSVTVKLELNF